MDIRAFAWAAGLGAACAAATIAAPIASAEPVNPQNPPGPEIVTPAGAPAPAAAPDAAPQAPSEVPHLSSLQNLPPGTSEAPVPGTESAGTAYARSVWQ